MEASGGLEAFQGALEALRGLAPGSRLSTSTGCKENSSGTSFGTGPIVGASDLVAVLRHVQLGVALPGRPMPLSLGFKV